MSELKPMTDEQFQLRRDLEPIIKRFRSHTITMRDAMTEIEAVFTAQLTAKQERIDIYVAALAELKVACDGDSDQPADTIVAGCIAELAALD